MIRIGGMAGLFLSGCLAAGALAEEPGRSVFAEVFEDGVPHPFAALLDRLREVAGEENVQTALIPVGRSLQRYSAAPDLFASPRLVVAVTADRAAGPGATRLADRLFLGFQPAGDAVEALSYDEAAGRFEFEEIVGYDAEDRAIEPARREICTRCHQGEAPIFPKPLWDESNASARIATRLAGLGPVWNGAPVAQSVDSLEAFDAAVRRAGRVELANLLWSEGCPDAGCRAGLLLAALGRLLAGPAAGLGDGGDFSALAATRWPDGIALIPGAIPNRDPLVAPGDPLETSGVLDPETPRAPETVWAPGPDGFASAATEIAARFTEGDAGWIEDLLARHPAAAVEVRFQCDAAPVGGETRFACVSGSDRVEGFFDDAGEGRLELVALDGLPPLRRVPARADAGGVLHPTRPARLADGRGLVELRLTGAALLTDDLAPLAAALDEAAKRDAAALGEGPFRRRLVLALIGSLMEAGDG